ncbi:MAG: glycosyltransferase family 4 protein, partial [Desulfovibrio sp.]|nr:glycosyltransferase family 4 protein [Desulfovibrio sp.]
NLLLAYSFLPGKLRERYPLLLIGSGGWGNDALHDSLRDMPFVRWLGYVPDTELAALYNLAEFMAYPSWYEGFGLPVAEAMACGCPVMTSNDPAILETSGGAARHVTPDDVDGMRDCMREMLEDEALRKRMSEAGIARTASLTWLNSAKQHFCLFREVCVGC